MPTDISAALYRGQPPTRQSIMGRVPTLPLTGLDHDAAISALTVAAMSGEITQDVPDTLAGMVRMDRADVRLAGAAAELARDVVARVCPVGPVAGVP